MNYLIILACLIFTFPYNHGFADPGENMSPPISNISDDSLKNHVFFLGNDSLKGRGTGTEGNKLAAEYIARKMAAYNLKPIGDNHTYFQSVPMHGSIPLQTSQLKISSDSNEHVFTLKKDYLLYKSGAQTYIPKPLPLVFVGYGIIAPEYDYNDYQSQNVDGKIVVFLSGEPPSNDSSYFNGEYPTIYSYPESKQRIAISRGARGSILIPRPGELATKSWDAWIQTFSFEDVTLAYSVTANLSIAMNPAAAEMLFQSTPYSLNHILEMEQRHMISSFPLDINLSFKGEFIEREFFDRNVLGMLEGRVQKPDDSYLIISAHYDHLGIGAPVKGDSIYNGVFDNAVGVSALLEIARAFSRMPERPFHHIIFLATTGEEKGLLGSKYYLDHPYAPLHKTIANVNIDGLSMFEEFKDVIGLGQELSTLGESLKTVAKSMGIRVSPLPSQFLRVESFARSDQIAFAQAGIPSILIAEGLHYKESTPNQGLQRIVQWTENVYHTPFDDLNQFMNFEAAQQHCRIIFAFCYHLAQERDFPKWNTGTPYINARLRSIAEKR